MYKARTDYGLCMYLQSRETENKRLVMYMNGVLRPSDRHVLTRPKAARQGRDRAFPLHV